MARIGRCLLVVPLAGCGALLSGHSQYCEEYVDCLDGNEADERVCVLELQESERIAKVYGCKDDFDDYIGCMKEEADCESVGRSDYWTADDDCTDEYDDYMDCLADESDLLGGGYSDTGVWNQWDDGDGSGGSGGSTGAGGSGGENGGSGDGSEGVDLGGLDGGGSDGGAGSVRDSCSFGDSICIESNETDNAAWCDGVGGVYAAIACPDGADGICLIPAGGDYAAPATAYYYGMDGAEACEGAGGTYTAN